MASGNALYYGDNLTIMRGMPSESVDLIYLDPPFNSQKTYNLIYRETTGLPVPEQEEAFCDSWELDAESEDLAQRMPSMLHEYGISESLVIFWEAWIKALRDSQPKLLAYLVYMSYRLLEMRRILRPTGSIYLHCDPTASHYIKLIMDGVFGQQAFRNELVWKRTYAHGGASRWGDVHDVILFYTKSDQYTWNRVLQEHDKDYLDTKYRFTDDRGRYRLVVLTGPGKTNGASGKTWRGYNPSEAGRHWAVPKRAIAALASAGIKIPTDLHQQLDLLYENDFIRFPKKRGGGQGVPEFKLYLPDGQPIQDVIVDVPPVNSQAKERLGYPTQKPLKLLDRIIRASSNEGDILFDPFCGCGTAIYAAHLAKRRWIGCDVAILSVRLVREVLKSRYGLLEDADYVVEGVPTSIEGAKELFEHDPRQFQNWVVEQAGGFVNSRHSGDQGVDGRIYFETDEGLKNMVISVKGGKQLSPAHIRELRGVLEREKNSWIAGFICLHEPTKGMRTEAARAGQIEYKGIRYDRLQIRTAGELLNDRGFMTPARTERMAADKQRALL